ncbi:MAG TPA: glycosyltransferase family 4 protein [Armatimonadota bacterium]|nr:glycosyltransferase family 4 protein [Armatimonadota bacterium]
MKIAMLGTKGIPATWGGIERHVEEIATRLVAMGHDVTVYCRPYYTTTKEEYYKGVRLKKLPTIPTKNLDAIVHTFMATMHIMMEDYDIVHYHAIGPGTLAVLARMAGKNTVITVHGLDWQREKWGKRAKLFLKFGERASVYFPYNTIAVSKFLKSYLEEKYHRPVTYIPSAVTEPVLRPPDTIRAYGIGEKDYILFVARLVPEKGCHYLIEAYERLNPRLKLVIAGGSSYSDDYVARLKAHASDKVILTGYVYGDTLQELYTNAYCYVQPSTIEGLPVTLLEAVAYGNCVIASDIPANTEVVHDAGIIFESENVDDLCDALKMVLDNPELAESLGERAKARGVEEYNYDRVTEKTEKLYRYILYLVDTAYGAADGFQAGIDTASTVEQTDG